MPAVFTALLQESHIAQRFIMVMASALSMPMAALASPTVPRAIRLAGCRVAAERVVGGLRTI